MVTQDIEDLRVYRDALRAYSTEDVEDIYFHIDILKYPLRYRLLQSEMQRRRLRPTAEVPLRVSTDVPAWLARRPCLARHPQLRGVILSVIVMLSTATATLAMLAPIWLFAGPWSFHGVQAALVYLGYAPVAPVAGALLGCRLGGRGAFAVPAAVGAAIALVVFDLTGTPSLILQDLFRSGGTHGPLWGSGVM